MNNTIGKRKVFNVPFTKTQIDNMFSFLSMAAEDCVSEDRGELRKIDNIEKQVNLALESDDILVRLSGIQCFWINRALEVLMNNEEFLDEHDAQTAEKAQHVFYRQWHEQDKQMNKNWMKPSEWDKHQRELKDFTKGLAKKNGKTRAEYIEWLETVLIPDLKESGSVATAEDFETCVEWMQEV